MKKIRLTAWANQTFDPPPSLHTLRRWARLDRIRPAPEFIGREWRVLENAIYTPPARIRLPALTVLHSTDPIVNDIISGQTSQAR